MVSSSKSATESRAPRIAIKFGAAPSSSVPSTFKPAEPTAPRTSLSRSSMLGKRPRSHTLDPESESEDDAYAGKHESVTAFGANGAETGDHGRLFESARTHSTRGVTSRDRKPLVIASQKDDWKIRARARARSNGKNLLPHEVGAQNEDRNKNTGPEKGKEIKWGLSVGSRSKDDQQMSPPRGKQENTKQANSPRSPRREKSIDQDALDSLLGKERKEKLVISDMDDACKRDVESAGAVSTLAEYDQIPDGEFGAALLRGLGWDGKLNGIKDVQRRENLLGLGGKLDKEVKKAEEAQKNGYKERRPRLDEYRRAMDKKKREREPR